jgi:hypothetical protein
MAGLINSVTPLSNEPDYMQKSADLYNKAFGRAGDAEGVKYWADQMKGGMTEGEVSNAFKAATKDTYNQYNQDPNQFTSDAGAALAQDNLKYAKSVDDSYKSIFGRSGDEDGANYWKQQLQGGMTAEELPNAMLASAKELYPKYRDNNNLYSGEARTMLDADKNNGTMNRIMGWSDPSNPTGQTPQAKFTPINAADTAVKPLATTPTPSMASTATAAPATTASEWNVGKDQTVEGRIGGLINDPNSILNQQAITLANQQMNARGLGNSSIAVSAAQDAMYKNALPIAQQDATTFAASSQFNSAEKNKMAMQAADNAARLQLQQIQSDTQMSIADKQIASQQAIATADNALRASIANLQADTSMTQQEKLIASNELISRNDQNLKLILQKATDANVKLDIDSKINLAKLDTQSKKEIVDLDAKYKSVLQTNSNAANLFGNYLSDVANISGNPNLNEQGKRDAYTNLNGHFVQGMTMLGDISGQNLAQYFPYATDDKEEKKTNEVRNPNINKGGMINDSGYYG